MKCIWHWGRALCATLALTTLAMADVKLPAVIGSNMVLQRGQAVPIWGWAEPGEEVTVTLGDHKVAAKADADKKWLVKLPALEAGGPHKVTVAGKNTLTLENVLVGEVWICSGQSNMEWPVTASDNPQDEIKAADYPQIRLFQIPKVPSGRPTTEINAAWQTCTPDTVKGFSAVAYFFGRKLNNELKVPVGLVNTSWGGTRIEPWTNLQGFAAVPATTSIGEQAIAADKAFDATVPNAKHPLNGSGAPTGLYNGMIYPIVPYAFRGALWYQGESNRGEGKLYTDKMQALIEGWRKVWSQGDFPFYFVQLAPYKYGNPVLALPEIWEAQTAVLKRVPNTGMAVTVDISNVKDIHPRNKQDVGGRLALWALAKNYGQESLVYSGPLYKSQAVEGGKIRVKFDHVGGGLAARDGKPLSHFQIAGADKQFVDAQAAIDGEGVVVSSDKVAEPKFVRFGWHEEAEPNLSNKERLPASPFRTDE